MQSKYCFNHGSSITSLKPATADCEREREREREREQVAHAAYDERIKLPKITR